MKEALFMDIIHLQYILELKHNYIYFTVLIFTIHIHFCSEVHCTYFIDIGKSNLFKCVLLITKVITLLECGRDGDKLLSSGHSHIALERIPQLPTYGA